MAGRVDWVGDEAGGVLDDADEDAGGPKLLKARARRLVGRMSSGCTKMISVLRPMSSRR